MTLPRDRLYSLLPAIYRQRDAEEGYPLRALLQVIETQVNVVEDDIGHLYDNWFIETCDDWVVPYIADLLGYRHFGEMDRSTAAEDVDRHTRQQILGMRREVAHTLRYRQRKGTKALLEEITRDVVQWPSIVVEDYATIGIFQNINHLHMDRVAMIDLRTFDIPELVDGSSNTSARSIDIRSHNIPGIGVFVSRLKSYPVTRSPVVDWERSGEFFYSFSVLRDDIPLFSRPNTADGSSIPMPISREMLAGSIDRYYGAGKSICIWAIERLVPGAQWHLVQTGNIVPMNLEHWASLPKWPRVALDPKLGRIGFSDNQPLGGIGAKYAVRVTYQYGFSTEIGGGEYPRTISQPENCSIYRVGEDREYPTISAAIKVWESDDHRPRSAAIEICDSGVYSELIHVALKEEEYLQLRAANKTRPVIRLLDRNVEGPDAISLVGASGSTFVVDGVWVFGNGLHVEGDPRAIEIRHCTLAPATGRRPLDEQESGKPGLDMYVQKACICIDHSIVGPVHVMHGAAGTEPVEFHISDSILDAGSSSEIAFGAHACMMGHAALTIKRSTVLGRTMAHTIRLAENCIFTGRIDVGRRQKGCIRFSYLPPASRTPPRFHCQPDTAAEGRTGDERKDILERVRPRFNSVRYGTPTYCQLADACVDEIQRGSEDGSEMGVFHDLHHAQRKAMLKDRIDEYTPADREPRLIFMNEEGFE